MVTFDGVSFEGRGIDPDLFVRNDAEELRSGLDHVLGTAIELLR